MIIHVEEEMDNDVFADDVKQQTSMLHITSILCPHVYMAISLLYDPWIEMVWIFLHDFEMYRLCQASYLTTKHMNAF